MGALTGFWLLDRKINGLQNGYLYVIGARPSMGKTSFALSIVHHLCIDEMRSAVLFSLEMPRRCVIERMVELESGIDSYTLREGLLESEDWNKIADAALNLKKCNLRVDDTASMNVEELRERCIRYKNEMPDLSAIFIDYLQLMDQPEKYPTHEEEAKHIAVGLKELANEINLPIIGLSQIARSAEKRADHRPVLADIRDYKGIENIADVIMFLYREDYYDLETSVKGIAEVIVAKNAGGPIGVVELKWDSDCKRFENIT